MQPQLDPYASTKKQNGLWIGMGAALLVVAIVAFGAGSGWFGLTGQRTSGLERTGATPPPTLARPAESAPVLEKPAEAAPVLQKDAVRMPQDVYEWLKHLEETERRRGALSQAQIGELAVQMAYLSLGGGKELLEGLLAGDADALDRKEPVTEFRDSTEKHRQAWRELNDFFKSVTPPQECVSAFSSYSEALGETSAMILEVSEAMVTAKENPDGAIAALNAMKGDSKTRIEGPARETDKRVQEICDKYETRKWFGIANDFGGGTMSQLPGTGR